ncbi:4Fe-4S binding protein [Pseudomonas sp. OIL-1]|uniref:4Fe-4S binding protein n=1 Tax=Pseudomonas sp. OIL-1 TaxID=2706126 RepID=UPI0013A7B1E8|nr:4Fe-4S binding protein [Pseudomonas sp. OIL-1]QIB52151.1 4Fe-4S binding protein [Pseudomonas sp. OIL-1]
MMLATLRRISRSAFFILFLVAPVLDLFRLDLSRGHFVFLTMDWTLGLDPQTSALDPASITLHLLLRLGLPILLTLGVLLWVVWRWGRLYCGWLCSHFSMVEWIDGLMARWLGRRSVWEKPSAPRRAGARLVMTLMVLGGSALWAITLLSYLVPPIPLWTGLASLNLPTWHWFFIGIGTALFCIEFALARHYFCKYGCAVGIFQSLIWAVNSRAMVIGFKRERARDCRDCNACDKACPMRLPPRGMKRHKITCTQCGVCVQTCSQVQAANPAGSLLHWTSGDDALLMDKQPSTKIHVIEKD